MKTLISQTTPIMTPKSLFGGLMKIGAQIKKLRKELGLTQYEFATKVKIHEKQLARYEGGRTIPSPEVIATISELCHVSTDYLILGTDKALERKAKITDLDLLELLRRIDQLSHGKRERIKWAIEALLNKEQQPA